LPALLVVLGVFSGLYRYFMASMRQAKRLEAVSRCVSRGGGGGAGRVCNGGGGYNLYPRSGELVCPGSHTVAVSNPHSLHPEPHIP
jgi:hypothetical protein